MKQRIIGLDVARAFAVIGMIIVNFKMVLGKQGAEWAQLVTSVFEGKAAATFVVLAGVGLALMSNTAFHNNDLQKLKQARIRITKRALFLFLVGLSYMDIWPADFLHFYGIYMFLVILLLKAKPKLVFGTALFLILAYPLMMLIWQYDTGWDFETFEYSGFWTLEGFVRNLFYNGYHPVFPWAAFMLVGLWFGRQDLHDASFIKKTMWISLSTFVFIQLTSYVLIHLLSDGDAVLANELSQILGDSPMPPLPIYMISGSSIALFVITVCIRLGKKFDSNKVIKAFNSTGQLALTFYVAHVVIGMGLAEKIGIHELGHYPVEFALIYALVFSLFCILFAVVWKKYKTSGPLEWLLRKVVG